MSHFKKMAAMFKDFFNAQERCGRKGHLNQSLVRDGDVTAIVCQDCCLVLSVVSIDEPQQEGVQ